MSAALVLDQQIRAAIPNAQGISIGDWADRSTWRVTPDTLSAAEHATADAIFAAFDLAAATAAPPDYEGFIHWIPAAFDFQTMLTLNTAYGMFPWFCLYGNAEGMAYCLTDALATNRLSLAQYALFQQGVAMFHLPVVLP